MPELLFYTTWLDKHFKKAFRKLTARQQEERREQLAQFLEALQACNHPATDPSLQPWRPTSYQGVTRIQGDGRLVEYRFPGLMRVIGCYFEEQQPDRPIRQIILLAATLTHDHDRMKRLLRQHRGEIHKLAEGKESSSEPRLDRHRRS